MSSMTFSIAACDLDTLSWGVAVASKFLAAGAIVPGAEAGAGAIATQAWANVSYRPSGLSSLRAGTPAPAVLDLLTSADTGRAKRQVGIVDATGGSAAYTGAECPPWAGARHGAGYAAQGNMLTGPEVVEAMERSWLSSRGGPLTRRLLGALAAGEAAGGDRRGRQSAALLVVSPGAGYGGRDDVLADLRVDDDPDPVRRLGRLLDLHELHFGAVDAAALLPLEGALAEEVGADLAALGYAELDDWAGVENLEERLVPGMIDPLVLDHLRRMRSETAG